MRIPLARCNLAHNKWRLLVSLAGIAFAVLLMFVQLGFWNGLMDASVALLKSLNGQVLIVNRARYTLGMREPFSTRRLAQARAVPGVKAAFPVYIEWQFSVWHNTASKDPEAASARPIRAIAFNPEYEALNLPDVQAQRDKLRVPGTVLIDRRSRSDYGDLAGGLDRELARRAVHVAGTFELGTDFTTDGNVVMSDRTFARLFPDRLAPAETLNQAAVGVVQVQDGLDARQVCAALRAVLPEDVAVYTRDEFEGMEREFWGKATPVGVVFTIGLVMGVFVGLVICSQILTADVTDHLKEYATLKAIGYHNRYLSWVVLQQALWLCLLAYAPALVVGKYLYDALAALTGVPLFLTPGRAGLILALTTGMCVLAGLLSLRKVRKTDPAEVFG
jgi:putative ABC transport system permease protein